MKKDDVYNSTVIEKDVENTILHGACLIFSPSYIEEFEGLNKDTFLYMEEDILKLNADYYKFKMLYSGDLVIYHKEDAATDMGQGNFNQKYRRKNSLLIDSSRVYSKLKRRMMIQKYFNRKISMIASSIKASNSSFEIDLDIPISYLIRMAFGRLTMLIRGKVRSRRMINRGKNIFIGKNVKLICKSKIEVGSGSTLNDNVYIDALSKEGVILGNNCSLGKGTVIRCSGNLRKIGSGFSLGDRSSLADNCFIGATGGVHIGKDVIMGQNVRFHSSNHVFSNNKVPIREQGIVSKGISIGNNCWIGAGVTFLDNASIGDGCVVAADSVITKRFPDNCVLAGIPAKIIKMRE